MQFSITRLLRNALPLAALLLTACGGPSGSNPSAPATPSITAADVVGTWKMVKADSMDVSAYQLSLVVNASTYTFVAPVSFTGQTACADYGAWSLSDNKLTITPIAGSSCGSSASTDTVSISGSTMTIVSATSGTQVYEKQAVNSVPSSALVGTWKIMATVSGGKVTPTNLIATKVIFNPSTYSISLPNCSETGSWSASGNVLSFVTDPTSTCGSPATYTDVVSLNNSLLTLNKQNMVWQKQAGAANSAPSSTLAAGASGGVNISWQLVSGATSYNVYRGAATGTLATKTYLASVASGTFFDSSAVAGATYYYQVTAVGAFGESAPSAEVSGTATTSASLVPNPVVGLTAIPGDTQVTLSWNAVSGATSYNVYYNHYSSGSIVPPQVKVACPNGTNCYPLNGWTKSAGATITSPGTTITGLVNGDNYQYIVTAVNANGESLATSYIDTSPAAPAVAKWTLRTSGTAAMLYDVAYTGTQFLAVGGGTTVGFFNATDTAVMLSSPDGITWSNVPVTAPTLTQIIWSQALSKYVAVGLNGTILTSPDAVTWTPSASGTTNLLCGLTWSSALGLFVAVGDAGTILTSPDGITWTPRTSGVPTTQLWRVKAAGNKLFAMGRTNGSSTAGVMLISADGITWTAVPGYTNAFYGIDYNGVSYVAVGSTGATAGSPATILTSPDAVTWTARTSANTTGLLGVLWNGTQWVAYGFNGAVLTSPDGVTWGSQTTATTNHLWGIASDGSRNAVVGNSGTIITLP